MDTAATVIDKDARKVGPPGKLMMFSWINRLIVHVPGRLRGMEIDRVWSIALVHQFEMHQLSLAHTQHRPRHHAIEGPGLIGHAIRNRHWHLRCSERDIDIAPFWRCRRSGITSLIKLLHKTFSLHLLVIYC